MRGRDADGVRPLGRHSSPPGVARRGFGAPGYRRSTWTSRPGRDAGQEVAARFAGADEHDERVVAAMGRLAVGTIVRVTDPSAPVACSGAFLTQP